MELLPILAMLLACFSVGGCWAFSKKLIASERARIEHNHHVGEFVKHYGEVLALFDAKVKADLEAYIQTRNKLEDLESRVRLLESEHMVLINKVQYKVKE